MIELATVGIVAIWVGSYLGRYDLDYAIGFTLGILGVLVIYHLLINRKSKTEKKI